MRTDAQRHETGTRPVDLAPRLAFEIAPPLMAGSRPIVSGVLNHLVMRQQPVRHTASHEKALLLASTWFRLASVVLEDLALAPTLPATRRWRQEPDLARHRQDVEAAELTWQGVDPMRVQPLQHLHKLLWSLPTRLLDEVLVWVPPVVLPVDRKSQYRVVANVFSAMLARQRCFTRRVKVYTFTRTTAWPDHSLPEICQAIAQALGPLYRDHERWLVGLAHDEAEALWLTGCGHAQYFRIRSAEGVGKP